MGASDTLRILTVFHRARPYSWPENVCIWYIANINGIPQSSTVFLIREWVHLKYCEYERHSTELDRIHDPRTLRILTEFHRARPYSWSDSGMGASETLRISINGMPQSSTVFLIREWVHLKHYITNSNSIPQSSTVFLAWLENGCIWNIASY